MAAFEVTTEGFSQASRDVPHFANQRVKNSQTKIREHHFYHLVTVSVFTHSSMRFQRGRQHSIGMKYCHDKI
jgi:hypothetical protein